MAVAISRGLKAAAEKYKAGETNAATLTGIVAKEMALQPAIKVEYLTIRNQLSLAPVGESVTGPAVILLAAQLGTLRLIDNMELNPAG